ncbi:MAG: phosphatase PAP2 family protein [Robiginitalea sp.]
MKKLLLILILASGPLYGQPVQIPADDASTWSMFTYDMGNLFKGIGYSYTRPLYWGKSQWATFGGMVAATGTVYLFDTQTSEYFTGRKEDIPQWLQDYGRVYGGPVTNAALTTAVYFTGLFTHNPKLRRTGVLLMSSAASAGMLQQFLKGFVGRARPLSGQSKDTFKPFWQGSGEYHSFPSGHTVMAFTTAYAIAKQFRSPWVKAGIYAVGIVPGISRLWEGKHWLSDVVFSVGLSIFTVEAIDRYLDSRYSEKYHAKDKNVSWNLQFGPGTLGVLIEF